MLKRIFSPLATRETTFTVIPLTTRRGATERETANSVPSVSTRRLGPA